MLRSLVISIALLVSSASAVADEKYILPIVLTQPVPGAFGSLWTSILTVHNSSEQKIFAELYVPCNFECLMEIPAGATVEGVPTLTPFHERVGPGDFLRLNSEAGERVRLSLRVQDLSRQNLTYGTEIPVVPLSQAFRGPLQLLGVPTADRFRQMLRVYDFDTRKGARVEVSIYGPDGVRLASRELELKTASIAAPGYAEIGWLAAEFPQVNAFDKVRVQVRPLTADLRFWAFISVTHNETQHLTVLSPAVH